MLENVNNNTEFHKDICKKLLITKKSKTMKLVRSRKFHV